LPPLFIESVLFRNGEKYSGEIHFVHNNLQTNKSAVLGIFMHSTRDPSINGIIPYRQRNTEIYTTENTTIDEWRRYFAASENLQEENNSTVLNLNLALLMGIDLNEFWRYEGSLTTPPCTEGIIWTIFKTPIMFTENELGGFRTDIFPEGYRGPQPLYDRIVYRNFRNETLSSIPDYNCCTKDLKNSANKTFGLVILQLLSYLFLFHSNL
jgi:carbonic anhydrase